MTDTDTTIRVELVQVTPALARQWIGRNADNQRLMRGTKVDQYARDMASGNWPITGDTVKVTPDNRLIDGQHRMSAVIQADTTVHMLIAYNVPAEVMPVLDTGTARTFSDVLKISGSPRRNIVGAIVRRIVMWERGNYVARTGGTGPSNQELPTHLEMLARYEKDPGAFDAAAGRASDVQRGKLGAGQPAGVAYYLFSAVDHQMAHAFFDSYVSGVNLTAGHPILALRNRMTRLGRDERLLATEQLALYVRSWNAYRENRSLEKVSITSGGRKLINTNFPQPK